MKFLEKTDVGIIGRGKKKNVVLCRKNGDVLLTSDILKSNEDEEIESITIQEIEKRITVLAETIRLYSIKNKNVRGEEPIVYGDALVELLQWIIKILMTHKHPPNGPPIPDWFSDARKKSKEMTDDKVGIINKNIVQR